MRNTARKPYIDPDQSKINPDLLREKLKLKHLQVKKEFSQKYPHVVNFFANRGLDIGKLRAHSAKILGTGILTGTLLLAPPTDLSLPTASEIVTQVDNSLNTNPNELPQEKLLKELATVLPVKVRPLFRDEEKKLERVFNVTVNIPIRGTLEGEHLNTTYGYIGAEQHLMRFPGDRLRDHGQREILAEGMAPGRGAWGYFSNSRQTLTPDLIEAEKWYAVVQTLYLNDWSKRQPYLRDWYKFRKVLIVNVNNGNAVVAAIADSGPAAWTGKHFGGSPEVMDYLGGQNYKKGPTLVFFVDDPENRIPLGPVEYNKLNLPKISLNKI